MTANLETHQFSSRQCSKFSKIRFSSTSTKKFQMYKLHFEKAEEPEINAIIHWIIEKASKFQRNICLSFNDYAKALDCVDHNKLWKILQEMGILGHLTCFLRDL